MKKDQDNKICQGYDIPRWGRKPSMSTASRGRLSMLGASYMDEGLRDKGEAELGGELENWLRRSAARRVS